VKQRSPNPTEKAHGGHEVRFDDSSSYLRGCEAKAHWITGTDAKRFAKQQSRKLGKKLWTYRCRHCGNWCITTGGSRWWSWRWLVCSVVVMEPTTAGDLLNRYDHSHNHDCAMDGHYCSVSCYDTDSGWGSYR
jgi:hypothetical protein